MDSTLEMAVLYIVLILITFLGAAAFVIFSSFLSEMRKNHDDHVRIMTFLDSLMLESKKIDRDMEDRDEHPPNDKGKLYYNKDGKASYRAYNENRKRQEQDKSPLDEIETFEREQI